MKSSTLILSIFSLLIASCLKPSNESDKNQKLEVSPVEDSIELLLDGEKKWSANPETTEGISNMLRIVKEFNKGSYPQLKQDLESEFKLIFKNCTMKGEAHDQLHNYLYPFIKDFKQLESENKTKQEQALLQIEERLKMYGHYFE